MNEKKIPKINREWCKSCGICIAFCPKKVLTSDEEGKACCSSPEKCINCAMCEYRCPDLAIELE